ncbi:hypothetical protein HDV04_002771, partial [Boothiomyces sp. JEL0838]
IVGMMINTLPVVVGCGTNLSLIEFLHEIQNGYIEALSHSHASLVDIQNAVGAIGGTSLFSTSLVFENLPDIDQHSTLEGNSFELLSAEEDGDLSNQNFNDYDIQVILEPTRDKLTMAFEYNPHKVSEKFVSDISNYYDYILQQIVGALGSVDTIASIADIIRLPDHQQTELLAWGTGPTYSVPFDCMHLPFEATARSDPDMIAVEHGDLSITYKDLDKKAESIAAALINGGIRPGDYVGIVTTRSIEMIIAIYGVLKAGAAYVPVDSTLPLERINYILETAQCHVSLVHPATPAQLIESLATKNVKKIDSTILETPPVNTLPVVDGNSTAFVVFTSGSTGKPKGVTIKHNSLCNFIMQPNDMFDMQKGTRVGQICTITFDVCACEIFSALSHGGTLVIRTEDLIGTLQKCDTIMTPPSLLSKLSPTDFPNLKVVISAGEPCPQHL